MSGPRPVIIKPPDPRLTDFEEDDEPERRFKGSDVPKEQFD
jgi:hypothetical protein